MSIRTRDATEESGLEERCQSIQMKRGEESIQLTIHLVSVDWVNDPPIWLLKTIQD
jgi:hypothetical protein